jgi:hypothetical protein
MLYNPPPKWTEELLDGLPFGEDDRYERKSGDEISKKDLDNFSNKISKEIGAFANSFGGTLFLGIADDKTKIGVPAIIELKRGNKSIEQWLEQKIPTLFELRLQHFRISRVEDLSEETKKHLSKDKVIIAIDVFDSELAPHQCSFDHRYYYRSNSESRPAPHHYLAFLWGRANSNMSQVTTWWLKEFLNPIIKLLDDVQKNFNQNSFILNPKQIHHSSNVHTYSIKFFNFTAWDEIISSSIGEYFLSTFPRIEKELISFRANIDALNESLAQLEKTIEESPIILEHLINRYETLIIREHIPRSEFENFSLEQISVRYLGQLQALISNHSVESKDSIIHFTAYALLDLDIKLPEITQITEYMPLSIGKDISTKLREGDNSMFKPISDCKNSIDIIKKQSTNLWANLKKERIDLAKRYTATFG